MGNCLKTQLKSVVDNDNLQKLNVLTLKRKSTGNVVSIKLARNPNYIENCVMSVVNGNGKFATSAEGLITDPFTTISIPTSETTFYFSDGDYTIEITNKYNLGCITSIPALSVDIAELDYIKGAWKCVIKSTGNLDTIKHANIYELDCSYNVNFIGNISSLNNINAATVNISETNVQGSLVSLENSTRITDLSFADTPITGDVSKLPVSIKSSILSTNITVDIEDFVNAQISKGRNISPTIPVHITSATSQPIKWGRSIVYPGGGSMWFAWESATKVTVYYGNSSSYVNCNRIFAKGATAEEISAWEQAGKTVVVVS